MPPTTENIPDKPNFDVYGTMVILTFLLTTGAALILRQDLIDHWGFGIPKEDASRDKVPVHITVLNENPAEHPSTVSITETDLKEWKLVRERRNESAAYPVRNFEWPQGYNPLQHPVRENTDNLQQIPAEQREALMRGWTPLDVGAGTPEPPKTEGGAAPTPPEGAAPPTPPEGAAPATPAAPAEPAAPAAPAEPNQ